jgi:hypothetical protein
VAINSEDGLLLVSEEIVGWKLHQNPQIYHILWSSRPQGGTKCNILISFGEGKIYKKQRMGPSIPPDSTVVQARRSRNHNFLRREQEDDGGMLT